MSLIERAVGRSSKPAAPTVVEPEKREAATPEERENHIEHAIARALEVESRTDRGEVSKSIDHRIAAKARSELEAHADVDATAGDATAGALVDIESAVEQGEAEARATYRAELDLSRLAALGMITPDADKTGLAEEFRLIKRPLIVNAMGRGASQARNRNLIMVTSAVPGEGKTFCAINLAMSMALERDYTVLLVDADVARPSVHTALGIPRRSGLMDALVGEKRLNEVIFPTNVEKLRILPAGKPHRHATELLASEAMAELLEDLATRYSDRIVVFDSPPLLATSEARALASQVGQVVVVVEAEHTTQQAVQEALREIESCEIVGLIYNKAKTGGDGYGYYSYGYGKDGQ